VHGARYRAPVALAALLDLDGTLVDANYHHAIAWYRALRQHGIVLPLWRLHRAVGIGGDQLVQALAGAEVEERFGDEIRAAEKQLYLALIEETEPFAGARDFIAELKRRGHRVVLASSAPKDQLEYYLDKLAARELLDGWTTSDDVEATKPEPDLVHAALEKAGNGEGAIMVGDTKWDIEAAGRAGLETICVITGGWSVQELRDAGALAVYESLEQLTERLDETPLA
jgi:HAD superfamily hydrolase (TIGR01549 family)